MAVEVIFNEIKQGRLNLDSEFVISENAWRRGGSASGGSAMFANLVAVGLLQNVHLSSRES